jgi:UDP-N-acetylglucosamine--N-acetylmuramyl-(pentapeptide) pyrophosphoryl-undecaprenol N-acetylglucosamine transferase
MRLLIAGGGTGGHLFPALAVAQAVRSEDPAARILFVGTRYGIESRIMPDSGFPIRYITARGMRRAGILNTVRGAVELPLGVIQSFKIIREFKPDFVLGVGGYASGPTVAAAVLMRIPTGIQEQNSVMGTTNRILAAFVDKVFTSWESTSPEPPARKTIVAGNPIRRDLLDSPAAEPDPDHFHVLIFGGSRGAASINEAVAGSLDFLAPVADKIRIVHQTGLGAAPQLLEAYRKAGIAADVREFIDDMGAVYHWADLVICRSGASSLAEITAMGKPAIVIPYPHAIGDHQTRNAQVLEAKGALRMIRDADLKNGALAREIRHVLEQPEQLKSMAENSRKSGRPDAARAIALEILKVERNQA